jgi:hypothetical protein
MQYGMLKFRIYGTRRQIHSLICAVLRESEVKFMHSCCRQVSEFLYLISHVYRGSNLMKSLLSVDEAR